MKHTLLKLSLSGALAFLAACGSGQSTAGGEEVLSVTALKVGREGGRIRGGEVELEIPAGALKDDVVVELVELQPGDDRTLQVVQLKPDGLVLQAPAVLTFDGVDDNVTVVQLRRGGTQPEDGLHGPETEVEHGVEVGDDRLAGLRRSGTLPEDGPHGTEAGDDKGGLRQGSDDTQPEVELERAGDDKGGRRLSRLGRVERRRHDDVNALRHGRGTEAEVEVHQPEGTEVEHGIEVGDDRVQALRRGAQDSVEVEHGTEVEVHKPEGVEVAG